MKILRNQFWWLRLRQGRSRFTTKLAGRTDGSVSIRGAFATAPRRAAFAFAGLFFVQTTFLGLFVTPLWSIPDESGHVSYALSLARGDLSTVIPVSGPPMMDADVIRSAGHPANQENWIYQHPPLYYVFAAVPLFIAEQANVDSELMLRAARPVTAAGSSMALLALFAATSVAARDERIGLALMALVAAIPMFQHLSTGTTNDTFLVLFASLLVREMVLLARTSKGLHGSRAGLWILLGSLTKATFWPPAGLATIAIFWMMIRSRAPAGWKSPLLTLMLAGLGPILWSIREFSYRNIVLATAQISNVADSTATLERRVAAEFFKSVPVLDTYATTFFGLIGWAQGQFGVRHRAPALGVDWVFVDGLPFALFSVLLFVAGILCLRVAGVGQLRDPVVQLQGRRDDCPSPLTCASEALRASGSLVVLFFASTGAFLVVRWTPPAVVNFALPRILFFGMLIASAGLLFVLSRGVGSEPRLAQSFLLVTVGTVAYFVLDRLAGYGGGPHVRAIHGRYLFALIPFFTATVAVGIRGTLRGRPLGWAMALVAALAMTVQLLAWVGQILPFFGLYGPDFNL